ncbi:hypothetical protein HUG10_09230 [Halorarum halophilum]|uniref:Uncharacterized protein n=1 Tax=Halorarum halophilum TaxID=2743090 RepID=A0A7D5L2S0_9EURY|nr:hypothetical protein [Halobaculum halophilum]QLG27723.1 hypothetical protein HUG10_09230 [Halobaculum halophilum]
MTLSSSILEPYREWEPRLVVVLTALLLFLDGIVTLYHTFLARKLSHWIELSVVERVAFIPSTFIVEPVLLFVALYYVSRRFDQQVPLVKLLPGLVVAVVVGSLLGDVVGVRIWG